MTSSDKERIKKESFRLIGFSGNAGYVAGATSEHERMAELLKEKQNNVRTLHQTLISRFYNDQSFNKDSLSKIIDEVGDLLK